MQWQEHSLLVLQHVVETDLLASRVLGRRAVHHGVLELPLDVLVDRVTEVLDLAAAAAQDNRLRVVGLLSFRLRVDTNEAESSALPAEYHSLKLLPHLLLELVIDVEPEL